MRQPIKQLEHAGADGCKCYSYGGMKTSLDLTNVLGYPIYATPDVCHLIKLVRNCIGDFQILQNLDGKKIYFQYFKSLQKLQEQKGLHLATRIKRKHIDWKKNKMSVHLATQLLSRSVADGIDYCRDVLHLTEFEDSEDTTEFIRLFDFLIF